MKYKIVVLAKQVPDTRNVGPDAMTPEGTVNRASLPAVFNPDDLNALEMALRIKDKYPESTISVITMGPPRATDVIREAIFRGADDGYLLTDRAFAGADTLATSYALSKAISKLGDVDIVVCGRQAIDGDTAQVGPQVAQKLDFNQVTYAEEVLDCYKDYFTIRRRIDGGTETVKAQLPLLLTVNGSAAECRPRNAYRLLKYKRAMVEMEKSGEKPLPYAEQYDKKEYLTIPVWNVADVDGDVAQCGLSGSPTKVKTVENIVFKAKESKLYDSSDEDIENLMKELVVSHTIG